MTTLPRPAAAMMAATRPRHDLDVGIRRRPDGSAVSPVMPFASLRELNAAEVAALYANLKGLQPVAAGDR